MKQLKVTIPLDPKGKATVKIGKKGWYNPSGRGMKLIRDWMMSQLVGQKLPLMSGPLLVIVHHRFKLPKAYSPTKKARLHNQPHTGRPDGDNLDKFLNDSLTKVIWSDDSQIAYQYRTKSYTKAKQGETIFYVQEIDPAQNIPQQIMEAFMIHFCVDEEEDGMQLNRPLQASA